MNKISKETSLCISIASRPSNFGTTIFNEAFAYDNQDFIYKAFQVEEGGHSLEDAIRGIRALGIRGCGVSMPFKIEAMGYVDAYDESATLVGALNTIVNEKGVLTGYNTDYFGAVEALKDIKDSPSKSVLLLGAGGAARAVCAAIYSLGFTDVTICNRTTNNATSLASRFGFNVADWEKRTSLSADILINTTNIGMNPHPEQSPMEEGSLNNFSTVMDIVISPPLTTLIKNAQERQKEIILGTTMSLHQAAKQYEIYTGRVAPIDQMSQAMLKFLHD